MVSSLSEFCIILSTIIPICLPIVLAMVFEIKYKLNFFAAATGAAVFFVFAIILEEIPNYYISSSMGLGLTPQKNPVFYIVCVILTAGIFEETGRFLAFKLPLKKLGEWKDGLAYGIGHGGIESLMIAPQWGLWALGNAKMINSGTMKISKANNVDAKSINEFIRSFTGTPALNFLIPGLERISFLIIQIALSIFLLYGIRKRKNIYLIFAILLHALSVVPPALASVMDPGTGFTVNISIEIAIFIEALIALVFIIKSRRLFEHKNDVSAS